MTYYEMTDTLADLSKKRPEAFAYKSKEATLAAVTEWHYSLKNVSYSTVNEAIKAYIDDNGKAPDLVDVCAELEKMAECYDFLAHLADIHGEENIFAKYTLLAADARSYRLPHADAV